MAHPIGRRNTFLPAPVQYMQCHKSSLMPVLIYILAIYGCRSVAEVHDPMNTAAANDNGSECWQIVSNFGDSA